MSEYNNLLYKIKKYRKYLNANPNSHNLQYKLNKYNNRLNNLRGGAKPESLVGRIPEDKFTEDNKIKKIDEYINEQLESVDESKREELKSTLKTDLEPILQAIDDNLVSKPAFEKYKEALTDAQEKIVQRLNDILNKIQNLKSAYAEAVQKYYECVVKTKEKTETEEETEGETEEETKPKEKEKKTEETEAAIADCDIKYQALLEVIKKYIDYKSTVSVGDLNVDEIVPSEYVIKQKEAQAQAQQAQLQQAQMQEMAQKNGQAQAGGTPPAAPTGGAQLMNNAPVVNRFAE